MKFTVGDFVTRKSYKHDVLFKINSITNDNAILHGVEMRLVADAPLEDLEKVEERDLKKKERLGKEREEFSYRLFRQDYQFMKDKRTLQSDAAYPSLPLFRLPIKVLHVDGDVTYLKKCIDLYKRIGIQAHGIHMNEKEMPVQIRSLIRKIQPEILVVTGHDSFSSKKGTKKDLGAYRNSSYFIETVREARREIPNVDQLIIFAGACQSHFESLIRAGANFASSPARINIHALDPVYIVAKIAYTPFMEKVNVWETLKNTFTGERGMGGIETRGVHRTGMPYFWDEA
ncbi:sporulation peptidase YabG [Ornithinibacillus sp. 4-3]|uniref:Sporulation peptidase YabG n=1 Tax=Ornithinibacillus sp. 4-3 TaxID=3231488 RepID=A0AB39HQT7_9BACI